MQYDLTQPCSNCPFLKDKVFPLRRSRDIAKGLMNNKPFACHKTTTEKGRTVRHKDAKHCGGALIVLEKMGTPHLAMLLGRMVGLYEPHNLKMDSPVYDNLEDFVTNTSR